jgi:hypothetical protein
MTNEEGGASMKRRTFIIATTCLASALATPGIAATTKKKEYRHLKARFVKVEDDDLLTIVKVDGSVSRPTPRDLEYWRKVFEEAQYDKDFHFHSLPKNGRSYWEVFDDKYGKTSLFRVTVNEIVWADPSQSFYTINSVEFGKLLIRSVKNKGVEATKRIFGVYGNLKGLADDDHIQYVFVSDCSPENPCLDTERCPRCRAFPSGSGG